MASANLFSAYLQPPKSVTDYALDYNKRDMSNLALQSQQQQNALTAMTTQQAIAKQNALQQIYGQLGPNADPLARENALMGNPYTAGEGMAAQKQRLENANTVAQTGERTSIAGKNAVETDQKGYDLRLQKANKAISDISALTTPQEALASLQQHLQAGDIDPQKFSAVAATIPQDPAQFPDWRKKMLMNILDAKTQLEISKPTIQTRNTGGTTDVLAINPLNGETQVTSSVKNTVSPDASLQAGTSRANNRDTIAGENLRAGVSADGSLDANTETTAQAIAKGQLPAPTGMALLNPKNQRVLGRVMEINPQYDFTEVTAKKAAATAFTSGTQGNALRSVSTANAHLDQLGELADAMGNGNTQVVNKAINWFKTQTGNPSATNFDAIKNIVGQEVVKAIVAGGGSAGERDDAANAFSTAKSPAQLKGAIQHYRMVMGAQQSNLLEQRRAAGLSDKTLPNYNAGSAAAPNVINFGDLK